MATLCPTGRIDSAAVDFETQRLARLWSGEAAEGGQLEELIGQGRLAMIDPFDRVQLDYVIEVCRKSASLSEAGRALFAASRTQRKSTNDADRLRKYLARFDLDWTAIPRKTASPAPKGWKKFVRHYPSGLWDRHKVQGRQPEIASGKLAIPLCLRLMKGYSKTYAIPPQLTL